MMQDGQYVNIHIRAATLRRRVGLWVLVLMLCGILKAPISNAQGITRVTQESQHSLRHKAERIRTDTDNFDGSLSSTEDTLQKALDVLDDTATTTDWPAGCSSSPATGDFCLFYDSGEEVVSLFVNGSEEAQWPEIATVSYLLLENGTDFLLLENSTGSDSKLKLE